MSLDVLTTFLGWSAIINYTLLLVWFIMFSVAHDWLYNLHGIWFKIQKDNFDSIHYYCMAIFKLIIIVFNITPYLVFKFLI